VDLGELGDAAAVLRREPAEGGKIEGPGPEAVDEPRNARQHRNGQVFCPAALVHLSDYIILKRTGLPGERARRHAGFPGEETGSGVGSLFPAKAP
jgi:hypothetical protein